jgi:broad specificity phosphatase PhoE
LERARETAEPLGQRLGLSIEISNDLLEVDFGDWNGATLAQLEGNSQWTRFNKFRSGTRIPDGETMLEIQRRMIGAMEGWRCGKEKTIALFSHGDPIRCVLVYYLGMPIDFLTRLEISPGSHSVLKIEDWGAEILGVNRL